MRKTVLLIAGGTGGHLFPAISLTKMNKNLNYIFLLDHRTEKIIKKRKLKYFKIYSSRINLDLMLPFKIIKIIIGIIQSVIIIIKCKPKLAIGFGGYTSIPSIFAAKLMNIKTIIHEQNAIMGRTNRLLANLVNYVTLTFKKTKFAKKNFIHTGIPIRKKPQRFKHFTSSKKVKRLLVIGGSQGAQIFTSMIPSIISNLKDESKKRIVVIQQIKNKEIHKANLLYQEMNVKCHFKEFFEDIYDEFYKADLIITRCGASTLAEIELFKKYSILFPLPSAMNNHQYYNAIEFKKNNHCLIVNENDLDLQKVSQVLQDKLFTNKSQNHKKYNRVKYNSSLSDLVEELLT